MADATVAQIFGDVRALLGDDLAEVFTDALLPVSFGLAYRELFDCLQSNSLPSAQREAFLVLPAYTNVLIPAAYGITDLDEPILLQERGSLTVKNITAVSNTTPIAITCVGHGRTSNTEVTISEVTTPTTVNQRWYITYVDVDHFTLNGSTAAGIGTTGKMATSDEMFLDMTSLDELYQGLPQSRLWNWQWQGERFMLRPADNIRQVRIEYHSSGDTPVSGSIGLDDCRSFLAQRTASFAAATRGMVERAAELKLDALGVASIPDGSGGSLRGMILPMIRELQTRPCRPQTFRPRRNVMARLIY